MSDESSDTFGTDWTSLPEGRHHRRFGDAEVGFDAWIWQGGPGPVVVVNGATHGDEYEGPTLLRDWVQTWTPDSLAGTVMLIPVLNEAAFAARSRCHPDDGGNLARAFPGKAEGAPTERLAHLFDTEVLARATHYVDLHSGGHEFELLPWVGFMSGGDPVLETTQRAMAACFDAFWCWSGPFLPGRTLSAAYRRGVAAIYTECRGAGEIRATDLAAIDRGLKDVLVEIGCLPGPSREPSNQLFHASTDAEDAHLQIHHLSPATGTFESRAELGDKVKVGDILGVVQAAEGGEPSPVRAEKSGTIVLRRHLREVRENDPLFVVVPI